MQYSVERLLCFALQHGLIEEYDVIQVRNALLDALDISEPWAGEPPCETLKTAVPILDEISTAETITERDLFDAKIMGLLMPRQSEVIRRFTENYKISPQAATDAFYAMSKASNYIQTERLAKNLYWKAEVSDIALEITINLSKPEKDPRDIARARSTPQTNYPKCLLCAENVGFSGTASHPGRQNHRIIPLTVDGERWYFQYSPYVYYNEHCIVLNGKHTPMRLTESTFRKLFDFVEQFPHYFVGSNADLPIVGGSILSHDHFQGGRHVFPMEQASEDIRLVKPETPEVYAAIINWPMSALRLRCEDKKVLIRLAVDVLEAWREYTDEAVGIIAYTGEVPHNTVTPIVRRSGDGGYEIDIVLRNNRTDEENPLGIFHPHSDKHHIKKENIGLIEVMGLAVLPGRLSAELRDIQDILMGRASAEDNGRDLEKHLPWIEELLEMGLCKTEEDADRRIKDGVAKKFAGVLEDAGVYKRDATGKAGFVRFLERCGFIVR